MGDTYGKKPDDGEKGGDQSWCEPPRSKTRSCCRLDTSPQSLV
jgi:hypothetical protein